MWRDEEWHLTLKIAICGMIVARKGNLRLLTLELLHDLLVCNVTLLVVFVHNQPSLVANATFTVRHEGIASIVILTDIAVYAFPTRIAVACWAIPWWPLISHSQRAA